MEATEYAIVPAWLVEYDYASNGILCTTLGSSTADPFLDEARDLLTNFTCFPLQTSPPRCASLEIERTTPQSLNEVTSLC